jgi:hypothetical protein
VQNGTKESLDKEGFVFDVYVHAGIGEVQLLELNPFGIASGCGSCLFNWVTDLYGHSEEIEVRLSIERQVKSYMDICVELDSCIQTSSLIFVLVSASTRLHSEENTTTLTLLDTRFTAKCQCGCSRYCILSCREYGKKKRVDRNVLLKYEACQYKYKYECK